jgi:hypothetical protein
MSSGFTELLRGKVGANAMAVEKLSIGSAATKTATASSGAATLNTPAGVITSEALTTAAAAADTLTLTNSKIAAADQVLASVQNGSNTQGIPVVGRVTPGAGSVVILVYNLHASQALNGTLKIAFVVIKN